MQCQTDEFTQSERPCDLRRSDAEAAQRLARLTEEMNQNKLDIVLTTVSAIENGLRFKGDELKEILSG